MNDICVVLNPNEVYWRIECRLFQILVGVVSSSLDCDLHSPDVVEAIAVAMHLSNGVFSMLALQSQPEKYICKGTFSLSLL